MFELALKFFVEVSSQLSNANNPIQVFAVLFFNGGWIIFLFVIIVSGLHAWQEWRQSVYHVEKRRFMLLAIDVPRDNEQSPKAVESIFAHLHGVLPGVNNKWEDWWVGRTPDYFSMEIVSIEGYVQFIVYTQEEYRDLVESAFYAQYPDAEITQVEDYVYGTNSEFKDIVFPHKKYNLYGSEFTLSNDNAYPIRLHLDFEHSLSQEFKDPMAALLETMNKIGPEEQFWFQLVITPEYDHLWQPQADGVAMKIAGKLTEAPAGAADKVVGGMIKWLDALGTAVFPFYGETEDSKEMEREMPSLMLHLTPKEQRQVESIQMKADKVGFWCKFRYIYIAPKEIATKARGLSPVIGSLKQFASLNSNALRPHKYTKTWGLDYLFVPERVAIRQNRIIRAFQNRARTAGSNGIILNTEELATLYHFPTEVVKAPLVSRTQAKRSSPPVALPIDHGPRMSSPQNNAVRPPGNSEPTVAKEAPSPGAPGNLPFV